jgi:membrane protease YdiL (CAAX protease family)
MSRHAESRSPRLFLVAVFASTWLFQLPFLLAEHGERFMPLVVLGFFGPLLIAIALSAREGRVALRALFAPLGVWRVHPGWYALALASSTLIFLIARALSAPLGNLSPWFFPLDQPQQIAALLLIPFTEQIPWRGYLYPRLERTHGALNASLMTGSLWALFHVQKHAFIDPHASLTAAVLTFAYMAAGTVVFSWIYLRTKRSMLLVVVANMGIYLSNPISVAPDLTPLALHTLGYCAAALALVLFDREVWSEQPLLMSTAARSP